MSDLFNNWMRVIQKSFEGLSGNIPEIEWVKAVTEYHSIDDFAAKCRTPQQTPAKILGMEIIMKAQDGCFFMREKGDRKPVWHSMVSGEKQTFRSPYLDCVLADYMKRGIIKIQPSASDIVEDFFMAARFITYNGTDEQFEAMNKIEPEVLRRLNNFHVPEDFDESFPFIAKYLREKECVPCRLKSKHAMVIQKQQP